MFQKFGQKQPSDIRVIKIDPWSVIKIILILIGFFVLYLIRDIILILVLAIIFSAAISPLVDALEKKKIRRGIASLLVYLSIIIILIAIILPLVPLVSLQINYFLSHAPSYYKEISRILNLDREKTLDLWQQFFRNWLGSFQITTGTIFNVLGSVIGLVFVLFMVFVIAFYMTIQKNLLRETLKSLLPLPYKDRLAIAFDLAQREVGVWIRGLFILCLSVALMAFIGLTILGVRYALVLSLVAGVTEIIPWIGPWLGGAIAVLTTLIYSPIKALLVAILFFAIQLIENNLLVPQVMKKVVGLNPLLVIIIVLIGGKLAGPIGVFLAVPVVVIISIFVKEYLLCRKIHPKT